ncbi:MAG: acyl transferase [Bacteroidota bacterium]|nr:acyl transferase [Bacteroidota bacterium]
MTATPNTHPLADIAAGLTDLQPASAEYDSWADRIEAFQRAHSHVYARYPDYRYLPIEAFKLAAVTSFPSEEAERVFRSSGTSGQQRSTHYVRDLALYERSLLAGYDRFVASRFGFDAVYPTILGHLPAYAEESSLVYMVKTLITRRGDVDSMLFLHDTDVLENAISRGRPVLFFGAAFGLLDLLEQQNWTLPPGSVIIETGGMKTHRREIFREELHRRLSHGFSVSGAHVVSEYGMCELLSQSYTAEDGLFRTPPWVRFEIIDPQDGRTPLPEGTPGALALFDMANLHTVSAILTQDLAVAQNGGFDILGRLNEAELRGCNFLVE